MWIGLCIVRGSEGPVRGLVTAGCGVGEGRPQPVAEPAGLRRAYNVSASASSSHSRKGRSRFVVTNRKRPRTWRARDC